MFKQSRIAAPLAIPVVTRQKNKTCIIALLVSVLSLSAHALPTGEQVVAGQAELQSSANALRIDQNSSSLIINYDTFNIAPGELVEFVQPEGGIALNRVTGGSVSEIFGQLRANGHIILLNPAGILFGNTAQVDVGGLIASTLSIKDEDFQSGRFELVNDHTLSVAGITNLGHLEAHEQGYIALVAPKVSNQGTVVAHLGEVVLAGADRVHINFDNTSGIGIELDQATIDTLVENKGVLKADGGKIQLLAARVSDVLGSLVDQSGVVEATSLTGSEGRVFLSAGDVFNSGTISTSAAVADVSGGEITVDAGRIAQFGELRSNGLGAGDGGSIHLNAADVVALGSGSIASANADQARGSGDGGEVIVFSPDTALFRPDALLFARGGANGGDGGFIEVSGLQHVEIQGLVDTRAPAGATGQFLIDPHDVTINNAGDANGSFDAGSPNVFTPSSTGANVDVATLQTNLQASSVTITTTSGGGEAGDLSVDNVIDLDGTNGNTLTLMADDDIIINADIKDLSPGTADATNITLAASDDYLLAAGVEIESNGGNIVVTGDTFFMNDNSLFDSGSGTITFNLTGFIDLGGLRSTNTSASAIDIVANALSDTGDTYVDIVANQPGAQVNLTIGTAINDIETMVNALSGSTSSAGDVVINESDAITVASFTTFDGAFTLTSGGTQTINSLTVSDAGANQTHDLTLNATAGDIVLGALTSDADIELTTATGSVTDGNGATNNLTGDALTLSIGGAITDIETDVATISGSTTAAGDVSLVEANAITMPSFTTHDGSFSLTSGGAQTVTSLTVSDPGADAQHDVTLTATAGDVTLGDITADDDITLNVSAGSVIDGNGVTNNLAGDTVNFTVAGAFTDVETNVATVNGSSTGPGDISVSEADAIDLTLNNSNGSISVTTPGTITATTVEVTTNPGSITLNSTGANILISEIDTNDQGVVGLSANAGAILDANTSTNPNISGVTTLTLSALNGIGDITSMTTATGDAIRVANIDAVNATTTADGSDLFISGEVPIAGSTFTPDADGNASFIIDKTDGALDFNVGSFSVSAGDSIGLLSNTTVTIPDAGITTSGDIYLHGGTDVNDVSGRDLNLSSAGLTFTSGMNLGDTTLITDVATLRGATTGAGDIIVNESDAIDIVSFSTSDGSFSLTSGGTQTITSITVNDAGADAQHDVNLATTAGDIDLGSIVADDDINLTTSAGSVTDNNATAVNLSGDTVTFMVAGAATDLETAVSAVTGRTTAPGDVSVTETNGISIADFTVANGSLNVTAQSGNVVVDGDIAATNANAPANGVVGLTAETGDVLIGTGTNDIEVTASFTGGGAATAPVLQLAANGTNSLIQAGGTANTVTLTVPSGDITALVPNSTREPAKAANSALLERQLGIEPTTVEPPEEPITEAPETPVVDGDLDPDKLVTESLLLTDVISLTKDIYNGFSARLDRFYADLRTPFLVAPRRVEEKK